MRPLQRNILLTYKQMYNLFCGVDEEEPNAVIKVKSDEVKL